MQSLNQIPGLGAKTLEKLEKLKIFSPEDLLYHYPHRYIDFSHVSNISELTPDAAYTVTGKVIDFQNVYTRSRVNLQKALIKDSTGTLTLIWFNQPYLSKTINIGETYSFAGTVTQYKNRLTIIAPEFGQYNTGKIIPVYPETKGLTSKWFRRLFFSHLKPLASEVTDPIPDNIQKKFGLMSLSDALTEIHSPSSPETLHQSQNRLALSEILHLQATSHLQKLTWESKKPNVVFKPSKINDLIIKEFINHLPYKLTPGQKTAWKEIRSDLLSSQKPSNRLLVGDVGSGKTIISIIASLLAYLNHSSVVMVAPTEILAKQHYETFRQFLSKYPKIKISLLTASSKPADLVSSDIIIATHAAFNKRDKIAARLGLVIIDEQHKFGVRQRAALNSGLNSPHILTMTATPIPRTISLTMLGHLDMSYLTDKPKDRLPIKTFLVPVNKQSDCYRWLKSEIKKTGHQAFLVCPFIEESEGMESVKSAVKEFEHLSRDVFPDLKLNLIHGKIKQKDRDIIINDFLQKKTDILVTTPIIEVGIDIPNSTIIIIQSADRFGLAQLHQLRGRVGRSGEQSYCYLFSETQNEKALKRLEFLQNHTDGFKIAQFDLSKRGPGEIFSISQHGFSLFKMADLNNLELIDTGQKIIKSILSLHPRYDLKKLVANNYEVDEGIIYN